ncbi:hypothetical protein FBZ82_11842 [Azospirillum brasilense]|uniref:Haloacid dehalogenase-like hydrolase n=1 Tax=Azospirillum brasilense TaxID=192 RepID=A0A560AL03_AZOBR|nr:hypothetical protein [Azospirillum brasilense]TWA61041.1 hypothetical protein FBZ82_11842 [Azospirillum brasilense]
MTGRAPLIGLDFDNTIVLYDDVFRGIGEDTGLLPPGFVGGKAEVRTHLRSLPDGEAQWTRLQAKVYGPGIARAVPAPGLSGFLAACRAAGAGVAIVSHKTEFAAADPGGVSLRAAAWSWIEAQGLTDPARGGIDPGLIFFEDSRAAKIARIASLGCRCFVDDLEEVFLEPDFPTEVDRILVKHGARHLPAGPFRAFHAWQEIADAVFGRAAA